MAIEKNTGLVLPYTDGKQVDFFPLGLGYSEKNVLKIPREKGGVHGARGLIVIISARPRTEAVVRGER